jgi:hypothetical protein
MGIAPNLWATGVLTPDEKFLMSRFGESAEKVGVHLCSLGTELKCGRTKWGHGAAKQRREAAGCQGRRSARRCRTRCWLAQQSAMIRGGVGAHLQHLTVRPMVLHVHLLSARFGIVIETYWR